MKKIAIIWALALITLGASAQAPVEPKPFIEITGTAEIKIIPDQIFISITLRENIDRARKSISVQEQDLIKALLSVGIPSEKLVVADANAFYGKTRVLGKEVVSSKRLELEVKDATQAKKAFEQMDKLNIKNAAISRVDHTQMDSYKKEVKIKAIKAAKEKATYLLEAVGEDLGNALVVRENSINRYANTRNVNYSLGSYDKGNSSPAGVNINFKSITISASIYTKWRIGK